MTLNEIIKHIDKMLPGNRFDNDDKTQWINEVEGKIFEELIYPSWHVAKPADLIIWKRDGSGAWTGKRQDGSEVTEENQDQVNQYGPFHGEMDPLNMGIGRCGCCCRPQVPVGELEPYVYETNRETELLAPSRFADIYVHYVLAKIHAADGEIDDYNNEVVMWRASYDDYAAWHIRNFPR